MLFTNSRVLNNYALNVLMLYMSLFKLQALILLLVTANFKLRYMETNNFMSNVVIRLHDSEEAELQSIKQYNSYTHLMRLLPRYGDYPKSWMAEQSRCNSQEGHEFRVFSTAPRPAVGPRYGDYPKSWMA
jgi:hypothetical protein